MKSRFLLNVSHKEHKEWRKDDEGCNRETYRARVWVAIVILKDVRYLVIDKRKEERNECNSYEIKNCKCRNVHKEISWFIIFHMYRLCRRKVKE